jgi:hypothetical protein
MIQHLAKNFVFILSLGCYIISLNLYGLTPQGEFGGNTGFECLSLGWLGFFMHVNLFWAWTANIFWGMAVLLYFLIEIRPFPSKKLCWFGAGMTLFGLALSSQVYFVPTFKMMKGACCSYDVTIVPGPGAQLWIASFVVLILAFAVQYLRNRRKLKQGPHW